MRRLIERQKISFGAVVVTTLTACLLGFFQGCSSDEAKYRKYERLWAQLRDLKAAMALQTNNPAVSHKFEEPKLTPEDRRLNRLEDDLFILWHELNESGYLTNANWE